MTNSWTDTTANRGWSIERPQAQKTATPFFPDQNGGVYEHLLAAMPVMLHSMDNSGRLLSVNSAWCEALGYETKDVIGRSFSEFLPMESRTRLVTEVYPRYLVSSQYRGAELMMQRRDGTLAHIRLSMTAFRGDKGRLERSVCILEDISRMKEAAAAWGATPDLRYKAAFAAAPHAMAAISTMGHVDLANDALMRMLGRSDLGKGQTSFESLLAPQDRVAFLQGIGKLLAGEVNMMQQNLFFVPAGGGHIECMTYMSVARDEKGQPEMLVAEIHQIAAAVSEPVPVPAPVVASPVVAAPVAAIEAVVAAPPKPLANAKKRILVVEDQEAVRVVACGFLEDMGYDIVEAENGFQALDILQEQKNIDLMFTDVVMPGGMNGFDLAQAAKQLRADLQVVITTGYPKGATAHNEEPRMKETRIIMKPYKRDELEKVIGDALAA